MLAETAISHQHRKSLTSEHIDEPNESLNLTASNITDPNGSEGNGLSIFNRTKKLKEDEEGDDKEVTEHHFLSNIPSMKYIFFILLFSLLLISFHI